MRTAETAAGRRLASRRDGGAPSFVLGPGRLFVSMTPASVVTILGSCVAVGLWDPESGVGGINHYLLPQWSGGADSLKFGDVANALLLDRFGRAGLPASLLRAKIFGGACVVEAFCHRPNALGVRNVEAARHFLAAHAIPVIEEHVLGKCGMRLCFSTADGAAVVRQLGS